jgi:hypothetical protein
VKTRKELVPKETVDSRLTKKYLRILRELSGLRLSKFPEEVLPAQKQAIQKALTSRIEENPKEVEMLEAAISALDLFEEKSPVASDFIARLITRPSVITLIYTVWLGLRGESWLWTISVGLIPLTSGASLLWRIAGRPKSFFKLLVYSLLEGVALGSIGVVTIKLAFLSGAWGLIQSAVKVDFVGILFGLIALFLGYHMCRYTVRLFFFLGQ